MEKLDGRRVFGVKAKTQLPSLFRIELSKTKTAGPIREVGGGRAAAGDTGGEETQH